MPEMRDVLDPAVLDKMRRLAADAPAGTDDEQPPPQEGDAETKGSGQPMQIEHKNDATTAVLEADDKTGEVTAIVSVTGVEDRVQDVIEPGAYTKTLAAREPIGVWSHDDKTWVARAEETREIMPGDPFFKSEEFTAALGHKDWPREAGALLVKARFNLDTNAGREAFSNVKFFEGKTSWSIGYRVTKSARNPRTGVRSIKELDLFEFSPVMVGANQHAMTLSVKSLAQPVDPDVAPPSMDEDLAALLEQGDALAAEVKKLPDFIKEKNKDKDDDGKPDPKRQPHKFQGTGGLCSKCMAPKGAKVHVDTPDEKALPGEHEFKGDALRCEDCGRLDKHFLHVKTAAPVEAKTDEQPDEQPSEQAVFGGVDDALLDDAEQTTYAEMKSAEDEVDAIVSEADDVEEKGSRASLNRSPKSNWVEESGDLPGYIREIARALERDRGMPLSKAIPIAIGTVKRWAKGGGDVDADTRAKAAKAVAEWEALKGKNKARMAGKDADAVDEVKAPIRRIRTPEGARQYGAPIGTVITRDLEERRASRGSGSGGYERRVRMESAFAPEGQSSYKPPTAEQRAKEREKFDAAQRAKEAEASAPAGDSGAEKHHLAFLDSRFLLPPGEEHVKNPVEKSGGTGEDVERFRSIAEGIDRGKGASKDEVRFLIKWLERALGTADPSKQGDINRTLSSLRDLLDGEQPKPLGPPKRSGSSGGDWGARPSATAFAEGAKSLAEQAMERKQEVAPDEVHDLLARGAEIKAAVVSADEVKDLLARGEALRAAVVPPFVGEVKAVPREQTAKTKPPKKATVSWRGEEVDYATGRPTGTAAGRPSPAKKAPAKAATPAQPKKAAQGRVVRSAEGARRYGVGIGEVYTKEKAQGELRRGESGARVKAVQDMLVRAGVLSEDSGANKGRDGKLGPKTEAALKKYQAENGLPVTGKFDAQTSKALTSSMRDEGDTGKPSKTKAADDSKRGKRLNPKPPAGAKPIKGKGTYAFDEDKQPVKSPSGGKLTGYFADGSAMYSDGSFYDPKDGIFRKP